MKKVEKAALPEVARPQWYWPAVGILAVLLVMILSRDISRPFYGLHSWGKAHSAWFGRVHAKYGFGYTKGLATWAVGNPPPENPRRYLDHPQLSSVTRGLEAMILGWSEAAFRTWTIAKSLAVLLVVLAIFRGLAGEKTAILAGLTFVLFPITGFFGYTNWAYPLCWLAIWGYLAAIGALVTWQQRPWHKWVMGGAAFLACLMVWESFFYCLAIGVHYVARCLYRRQWPDKPLLTLIIAAPVIALTIDFTIMAVAWGDFAKIIDLYRWRSTGKDVVPFTWGDWFKRFWEFAATNFTWPLLVAVGGYLVAAPILWLKQKAAAKETGGASWPYLPGLGILLLPGVFQLTILKNALRPHQYWEGPLSPFLALCAAMAILLVWELIRQRNVRLGDVALVAMVGFVAFFCAKGVNHYYYIRWQPPAKIDMFKMLNKAIPPDKALLSFEPFTVNENPVKGEHYRPEIAYYLDREIIVAGDLKRGDLDDKFVVARKLDDILQKTRTGKYPFYLMPRAWYDEKTTAYLDALAKELSKRYRLLGVIPGAAGESDVETDEFGQVTSRTFLRAGMPPYVIFDLRSRAGQG